MVMVADVTGRVIRNIVSDGNEVRMSTGGLNNGIYFLSVNTEAGVSVNKLQIQR